jgi:hypothetical protein
MHICLYLDPSRLLRWHQWLAEALAGMPGNEVSCAFAAGRRPLPTICRLLLELERLVYGLRGNGATDPVEAALLARVDREVFAASLDGALSCAVALIVKALREETGSAVSGVRLPRTAAPSLGALQALARTTSTVTSKAIRFLDILARGGRTWAIGWRFDQSASLLDKGEAAFRVLTGDSHSYLADPFPFRHQGQNFIFVEQYLYSKNRGCIAVVAANRNVGAPQVVLEEPHHPLVPVRVRAGRTDLDDPRIGGGQEFQPLRGSGIPLPMDARGLPR